MSAFLVGYIVLSLILLISVNGFFRRSKKRNVKSGSLPTRLYKETVRKPITDSLETVSINREEARNEDVVPVVESIGQPKGLELNDAVLMDPSFTGSISGPITEPLETPEHQRTTTIPKRGSRGDRVDKDFKPGRIVGVLLMGVFIAILNQTLINVALPHMMNDLNVSANTIQWLVTGYMLANGVLIPITAYLMETFSTRKLFISAMLFFTVGSLICALSPNFSILLFGRLVQAVGAGIMMPLMMTVFLTIFPPEKRGKAMGMMGIAMIFAPAIGPTLSGYLVQNYTWRLLFYLVIPIAIVDILLAVVWLKNVTKLTYPKFDIWGAIFSTLGFGGLLYGCSEAGNKGWDSFEVIASIAIGVISLVLFVWRQLTAETPMLEFRVFKYDIFTLTTIISSIINMAMFAAMVLLPIYLQNIRGFSPLESGLLLLPGAVIMGIMSPIAGAIFDKIGARLLAVIGLLITVITTWQFSQLTMETTYSHILVLYCMRMFGMSFLMMTVMTAGLNQLPRHLNSHGTAMSNTMRQVAGSLGTAVLVTVMSRRASFHLADYSNVVTSTNPLLYQQINGLGQRLSSATGLPAQAGTSMVQQLLYGIAAKQSVIDGINDAFIVATWIAVVALVLAFFIKRAAPTQKKVKTEEEKNFKLTGKELAPREA